MKSQKTGKGKTSIVGLGYTVISGVFFFSFFSGFIMVAYISHIKKIEKKRNPTKLGKVTGKKRINQPINLFHH